MADNIVNQKVANNMLKKIGYQVKIVSDGQEAIDALVNEHFDLILMDCQMPVLDGYQATQQIRIIEKQKNKKRVPILALTANGMEDAEQICLNSGS